MGEQENVPRELRDICAAVLGEFRAACEDGSGTLAWLPDYEVLELRTTGMAHDGPLEVYLPRPLLEDLTTLDLAARRSLLEDLRAIPGWARAGHGRFWLLREQGRARSLPQRPFA